MEDMNISKFSDKPIVYETRRSKVQQKFIQTLTITRLILYPNFEFKLENSKGTLDPKNIRGWELKALGLFTCYKGKFSVEGTGTNVNLDLHFTEKNSKIAQSVDKDDFERKRGLDFHHKLRITYNNSIDFKFDQESFEKNFRKSDLRILHFSDLK